MAPHRRDVATRRGHPWKSMTTAIQRSASAGRYQKRCTTSSPSSSLPGTRTGAPTRALSCAARPPAWRPGAPRSIRRPPRRSPCRSPRPRPAARPGRTPGAARGSPGTARTGAAARRSSGNGLPTENAAGIPTRTPAALRTPGSPGAGTPAHGPPVRTHRRPAGTAIRWPRAAPPRIPSRDVTKRRREGIPHAPKGTPRSWPARPGSAAT